MKLHADFAVSPVGKSFVPGNIASHRNTFINPEPGGNPATNRKSVHPLALSLADQAEAGHGEPIIHIVLRPQ